MKVRIVGSGPDCTFCMLEGDLIDRLGFFIAGLAYGTYQRPVSVCKEHLPQLQKSAEEAGDIWEPESMH